MRKHKHLTLDDRIRIQQGLEARESFKAISREPGKDPTTISKEIKGHIQFNGAVLTERLSTIAPYGEIVLIRTSVGRRNAIEYVVFAILLSVLVFAKTMFQRTAAASASHQGQ